MAKIAGNYLSGQLIKTEALERGFEEGIALSTGGMVSEGSGQNMFIVDGGVLCDLLYTADEILLSGTASEITPVRSVDKLSVSDGKVGPITRRIQQEYLGICKGEVKLRIS